MLFTSHQPPIDLRILLKEAAKIVQTERIIITPTRPFCLSA